MLPDDIFEFGANKGLSLERVFTGTEDIPKELIFEKAFSFLEKMLKFNFQTLSDGGVMVKNHFDTINITNFSKVLSETKRIKYRNPELRRIEMYFYNMQDDTDIIKDMGYDLLIYSGNPTYIEWCNLYVDKVKLSEETISHLEKLDILALDIIKIEKNKDDTFYFTPVFKKSKYKFGVNKIPYNF